MPSSPLQPLQICLYTFSLILATAAIICRILSRRQMRIPLQLNDWLMVVAYVNVLGLAISANIAVVHGEMGRHQFELSETRAREVFGLNMKMTIVIPFLLSASSFLVKMSITHFCKIS
ncbi:hypothetical protein CC86DRAFT_408545 [Ophiobolus disseminans]|uniref:Rhodopsin domain-containing protein n=1 Tax=Ophiobolus disseminans TaxID=1469910 RepID=A0A6A6ZV52_9PLEO|nr:hypothetical protein CC86DRAFT_408545 [Ophiobolus disseminans]